MHADIKVKEQRKKKLKLLYFWSKVLWQRVKVPVDHPEFGERLRNFLVSYNARHI